MQMSVSTNFSKGFYILKSTEDGKTDLDLATKEGLSEDLMTNMLGAPLEGAPLNMSVVYGQCYIDDATQEMAYDKVLNLFTEKDYRGFRTEDMAEVHNRQTIFYEPAQDDEVLYGMEQGMMATFLFTNKGYYGGTPGGENWGSVTVNTGKHGFPVGSGASRFMQQLNGGYAGVAYWDEVQRMLCLADYNAVGSTVMEYELPDKMSPETVNCIACGLNYVGRAGNRMVPVGGRVGKTLSFIVVRKPGEEGGSVGCFTPYRAGGCRCRERSFGNHYLCGPRG